MPPASAKGESHTSPSWPSHILRQATRHLLASTSVLLCLLIEADLTSYSVFLGNLIDCHKREVALSRKLGTCLTEALSILFLKTQQKIHVQKEMGVQNQVPAAGSAGDAAVANCAASLSANQPRAPVLGAMIASAASCTRACTSQRTCW